THTTIARSARRMDIMSPALTVCADFARCRLRRTSPAAQRSWAIERRGQRRLSFRKRSRRIESKGPGAKSRVALLLALSSAGRYGLLFFSFLSFLGGLLVAAAGGTIFRRGSTA